MMQEPGPQTKEPWQGFAELQVMGHVSHVGYLQEVEQFGITMVQIEPIGDDGEPQEPILYGAGSIYSLRRLSEEAITAKVAQRRQWAEQRQRPFARPALPAPPATEMCHQCYERPPEAGTALCAACYEARYGSDDDGDERDGVAESFQDYGHPTAEEVNDARVEDRVGSSGSREEGVEV